MIIIRIEVMAAMSYEKRLTSTDVSQKLVIPRRWLEILPSIKNNNNVQVRVLDGMGMCWEFFLSRRSTGNYPKPVFQSKGWSKFVRRKGLRVGDKLVVQRQEDPFRETQYLVRVQRQVREDLWLDLEGL